VIPPRGATRRHAQADYSVSSGIITLLQLLRVLVGERSTRGDGGSGQAVVLYLLGNTVKNIFPLTPHRVLYAKGVNT
jgi:hypothetical protein